MVKKTIILAFSRDKLSLVKVSSFLSTSIKIVKEWPWNDKSLADVLKEAHKSFSGNKIRVLVSDDLSYFFDLEIEKNLKNERAVVSEKIAEEIPELLENEDWDYRVISETEDKKQVITFALIHSFWLILKKFSNDFDLEIEAIESISLAQRRNENPLLALANKKDIKGADENVLNLEINHQKKLKFLKYLFGFFIISVFVFLFLLFASSFKKDSENLSNLPISISSEEKSDPELMEKQLEAPELLDLSEYLLEIQNGSGLAGEGNYVAGILEAEGFNISETSNADNYDYRDTLVFLAESIDSRVFDNIERALNDEYRVSQSTDSSDISSQSAIVVIVGKKIEINN